MSSDHLLIKAVFVDQLFSRFSIFFPKEKQEKQDIFASIRNLTKD